MAKDLKTVIVSVYGRGDWLASELAQQGEAVTLVDLTSCMGPWSPEDIEGPFGVFRSRRNTGSQMARLEDEDPLISNDNGIIIWTQSRAVEMKGPLSAFQLKNSRFDVEALDYVRSADGAKAPDFVSQRKKMGAIHFETSWIAHLAHQFSSTVFMQNAEALSFGRPSPFSSPFFFRRLTRRGRVHSYQRLEELGVKRIEPSGLNGPHIADGSVAGLSLDGEQNVVSGDQFVWMLSSEETEFLSRESAKTLFPKGPLAAQWYWTRYRVRISDDKYSHLLPSHFVMISDPHLPWTHDNMCIVQRTAKDEDFDVWIRLPREQRFLTDYVKSFGDKILAQFVRRMTGLKVAMTDWPQEVQYDSSELGPAIHPVYDLEGRQSFKRVPTKNLLFDGPEVALSLSWSGQFRSNEKILKLLKERFHAQRVKKGESRGDLTIHPT